MSADAFTCRECGELEAANWLEPKRSRLLEMQLCFMCEFWTEKIAWREAGDLTDGNPVARIDGTHYVLHPFQPNPRYAHCLGFGGRSMTAVFHDGRAVTSNDVWYQGKIPDRFRDRLPDNAQWAKAATS